jgi:hypothetical protein
MKKNGRGSLIRTLSHLDFELREEAGRAEARLACLT